MYLCIREIPHALSVRFYPADKTTVSAVLGQRFPVSRIRCIFPNFCFVAIPLGRCNCLAHVRQRLLAAFGDFFESLPPRAEAKLLCARFVCDLTGTLMSSTTRGGRRTVTDLEAAREVRRWLQSLPELLCCWNGEFPENSTAVLQALVGLAKYAPAPPTPPAIVEKTDASPGKSIDGKARGKTATPAPTGEGGGTWSTVSSEFLRSIEPAQLGEFFSGRSFLSLPASAQTDAVSLLFHLPSVPVCVVSALASACSEPAALSNTVRSFVLEVSSPTRL